MDLSVGSMDLNVTITDLNASFMYLSAIITDLNVNVATQNSI